MHINRRLQIFERSGHCMQFGVGEQSIVLDGLTDPDKKLLRLLMEGTDKQGPVLAGECGLLPARAQYLLQLLDPVLIYPAESTALSGLRSDRLGPDVQQWSAAYEQDAAPLMERRSRAAVRIAGLGRTGSVIAQALAAAGIGTLLLEDEHRVKACDVGAGSHRLCDIGMTRTAAVRRQIHHIDPTIQAHPISTANTDGKDRSFSLDLVISVSNDVTDDRLLAELMHHEHPHLPVVLRDHDVLIGPLVVPGETACSECIDRHRADQDPQWLDICRTMRQRAAARDSTGPEESALALSAAGSAVLQSLLLIDGVNRPSGWSSVVQLRAADGSSTAQGYTPHPGCGCMEAAGPITAVS